MEGDGQVERANYVRQRLALMRVSNHSYRLQTTQPTSGGAVTADSSYCANCVEPPRPQQWGPDSPFFGHAGHADPLDGWCCCSQKRIVAPGFVDRPRRSDCTAGQMDGEAGWWTTSGNIGLPPLARVMGVGRQQQKRVMSRLIQV